jgi:Putative auto-transporter adhesin, head GIN domain
MTVGVTVPTLETVVLSGSGVVTVEGVTAERLVVRAPGSGVLTISGTAEQLDVSLTGSGDVRLEELVARDVAATLFGSGRLQVHATDSLDASVPGTGVIVYRGNPSSVTTDVSGTGVITKQ